MIFEILTIFIASHCVNVNSWQIAGNRTISECVNGYVSSPSNIDDSEQYLTTSQLARNEGYPAEEHSVMTDDGYILTLHRIPSRSGARPIFLQHGLFGSSFDWIVMGKNHALAYKLADAGYDVWMGNFRGNTYSRCHTKYQTSSFEFWDFSWHEMGTHDLPAMITYVANITGQRIIYIGHSMGNTAFFVTAIERPNVTFKVNFMLALGPIVYLDHSLSPSWMEAQYSELITKLYILFTGTAEFLPNSRILSLFLKYVHNISRLQRMIIPSIKFDFPFDFNSEQFDEALGPRIFAHVPAGTSIKCLNHYTQGYNSRRFQYYDHGPIKNSILYNSTESPDYNISKINVPIGLFWSESDLYTTSVDITRLYNQLPNALLNYRIVHSNFHHTDFVYGIDAPNLVYEQVMTVIAQL